MINAKQENFLVLDRNKKFLRVKRKKDQYNYLPESYKHNNAIGLKNGRWSIEEHEKFILGVIKHGNNWKEIIKDIGTRNCPQARSHCQKSFNKLMKNQIEGVTNEMCNVKYLHNLALKISESELKELVEILLQAHLRFENFEEEVTLLNMPAEESNAERKSDDLEQLESSFQFELSENEIFRQSKKPTVVSIKLNNDNDLHDSHDNFSSCLVTDLNSLPLRKDYSNSTLNDIYDFSDQEDLLINQPNEYSYEHITDHFNTDLYDTFNSSELAFSQNLEQETAADKLLQFNYNIDFLSKAKKTYDRYYEMMKTKMFLYMRERGEIKQEEPATGIFYRIFRLLKGEEEKVDSNIQDEACLKNFVSIPVKNEFD